MAKDLPNVTDTELAILAELWCREPATIRELTDAIYEEGSPTQYATVQSLLDRLEFKKCVRRDRSAKAHLFEPLISRDEFIGGQLKALADRLCDGSVTPLMTNLIGIKRVTPEDLDALRAWVKELAKDQRKGKSRKR